MHIGNIIAHGFTTFQFFHIFFSYLIAMLSDVMLWFHSKYNNNTKYFHRELKDINDSQNCKKFLKFIASYSAAQ